MTNFEYIKSLSLPQFAAWMEDNVVLEDGPHIKWFDETYCMNCPPIDCQYKDGWGNTIQCSFCEFEEHCKFFPEFDSAPDCYEIATMWLEAEHKD